MRCKRQCVHDLVSAYISPIGSEVPAHHSSKDLNSFPSETNALLPLSTLILSFPPSLLQGIYSRKLGE